MKKLRTLKPAQMILGVGLVVLALGGTATAAKTVITGKQIKDSSVTGKDVRDGSLTAADFNGAAGQQGPQGPAGSAVAFADIRYPGAAFDLNEARSKNITTASEHPTIGGIVCLNVAVPFVNAVASPTGGGGTGVAITVDYDPETGGAGNCPVGTDVSVRTLQAATSTALISGFSIVFN